MTSNIAFYPFTGYSVVYMTMSAFVLSCGIYLAVSLCIYFQGQQVIARRNSITERVQSSSRLGAMLRRLCLFVAIALLVITLCGLILLIAFQFFPSLSFCDWISKGHYVLRTSIEILFNVILWFRQIIFYQHPTMKHLTSKLTNAVSWLFFVLMIAASCLSLFVFMFGYKAVMTSDSCVMQKYEKIFSISEDIFFAAMVALIVIYRCLFLGLLLFPLVKHKQNMGRKNIGSVTNLMRVIRRVLVADILCIILFILVAVLTSTLLAKYSIFLLIFLWEGELILGFIFIMVSFVDWKKRLLPFLSTSRSFIRSTRDRASTLSTMTLRV